VPLPGGPAPRNEAGLGSITFPAISTGIFGYPVDDAARIALAAI
jgi:O-acetyl-ADP-ribose deacetylase (regulator of RNase III)